MQQVEADKLVFLSQGNNSMIHRSGQNQVIKSVYHKKANQNQQKLDCHQIECEDLKNEWSILKALDHPHIIKPNKFCESIVLKPDEPVECCSLQLEGALCDMFGLLRNFRTSNLGSLSFKQRMKYMHQIGSAVHYLHQQDIQHNDIKLENILLCNRDAAKLADFGFSSKTKKNIIQRWNRRSLNVYSAPEIVNFKESLKELQELDTFLANLDAEDDNNFDEQSADVFALTTSLFISIYYRSPIAGSTPSLNDPLYDLFCHSPDDFWELDEIAKVDQELISDGVPNEQLEQLKDLLEHGLCDQDSRINITDWYNHEVWNEIK